MKNFIFWQIKGNRTKTNKIPVVTKKRKNNNEIKTNSIKGNAMTPFLEIKKSICFKNKQQNTNSSEF